MTTRRFALLLLSITIMLILVISACRPEVAPPPPTSPEVTVTPTEVPTTVVVPSDLPLKHLFDCNAGDGANAYFVCDQVILIGPNQDINQALFELNNLGIPLQEISERLDLSFLSEVAFDPPPERIDDLARLATQESREAQPASFPFHDRSTGELDLPSQDDLAMGLFDFSSSGSNIIELLNAITGLRGEDDSEGLDVYADPNYLLGHLTKSPCANPFAVEGSPFAVEGSPFAVEGSPNGGKGIPASGNDFWPQWAFKMTGIIEPGERLYDHSDTQVNVVVLDTSPFMVSPGSITVIDPALNLTLADIPPTPALPTGSGTTSVSVADHGYFVSGLIHAVAPNSSIHLYPVLDSDGCGGLDTLVRAIFQSIDEMHADGSLAATVYNLSLGVKKPRFLPVDPNLLSKFPIDPELKAILEEFEAAEKAVESLETAVFEVFRRGAVIVAAAGNDSVSGIIRLESELPAAYSYVIGVEATNQEKTLSCFSNLGDVSAPGGDAIPTPGIGDPPSYYECMPMARHCTMTGSPEEVSCPWGLISLSTDSPEDYAYWEGTSFATPLVSGLAAWHLSQAAIQTGQIITPEQVRREIITDDNPSADPTPRPIISLPDP